MNYYDGYFSNSSVIWVNDMPYKPQFVVPNTTNADISVPLDTIVYSANSYTYYDPVSFIDQADVKTG